MALNEVLVIDDNTDILKLLNALLQQHNFKVRLANSGAMAIKSIQAKLPDLILLDVTMPEMNGIEICKHIKSNQKTNHIPIIFLSAQKNDKQIAEGLLAGGVDFISKPFSVETLLLRIGIHIKINQLQKDLSCFNLQLQNRVENRTRILHETNKQLKQLKYAIKASYSGIWDWDLTTNKFHYNDAFFSMLGYQPIDFLQDSFSFTALIHSEDITLYKEQITRCLSIHDSEFQIEYRLRKQDTTYCWVLSKGMVVEKDSSGHPLRMTGTHTDISAEKQKQQSLRLLSQTDPLTGLANRAFFITQVNQVLINTPGIHALFFIDLDGFKQVNDTFGHHAGDTVLTTVAERLCCLFRQKDILCRFGGDEFAIFLSHSGKNHFAPESATRILKALNTPIKLDGESINISSSIGISFYPHDGTTAQMLLKNADIAMYQAKAMGKNTYQLFSPNIAQTITKQKSIRNALKSAVKNHELILYFQPQIDVKTQCIIGVEALCRWQKEANLLLPPKEFISIAEKTGLIIPIGHYLLDLAFQNIANWSEKVSTSPKIAINISERQFYQKDLLNNLLHSLNKFKLPPECLQLEINESILMNDYIHSLAIMNKIKRQGISLAIDNYGSSYTSLTHLKKYPVDIIKIDMSFIKDMTCSNVDQQIVESIINLSHALDIKVTAEGVETEEQANLLSSMGCDTLQGYFCSKPISANKMSLFLQEN